MNAEYIIDVLNTHWKLVHPNPPGCISEYVPHPSGSRAAAEIGVVIEHRFAFYYWLSWRAKVEKQDSPVPGPPSLVTIDWHNDVGGKCDYIEETLKRLNYADRTELALFSWCGLRPLNDGHIAPALFLNAVQDVYVVCKQNGEHPEDQNYSIDDLHGKRHDVCFFSTPEALLNSDRFTEEDRFILDLDLDYFAVSSEGRYQPRRGQKLVSDREVKQVLAYDSELMSELLPRMEGMTVALEPSYCGGLSNSLHLWRLLEDCLFTGPIAGDGCDWKHLGRESTQ